MASTDLLPFAAATAIGLLVGFERERSHRNGAGRRAGSRTFALVGLCGALCASIGAVAVAAGLLVIGMVILALLHPRSSEDPGITSAVAALTTFLLGSLALTDGALAVGLAVIVTVLLVAKRQIHAFARDVITAVELEDALTFGVIAFVILPLLPDTALGPYDALNPHRIWLAVVVFTTISWVGYIAVRAVGPRRGSVIAGFAGGFVSATATTATMARRCRDGGDLSVTSSAALWASIATFIQLAAVLTAIDSALASAMLPACAAASAMLGAVGLLGLRGTGVARRSAGAVDAAVGEDARPFSLRAAFLFAAVLTAASFVGEWAAQQVGSGAAVVVAGFSGLADAHAGAAAAASMSVGGDLDLSVSTAAVGAALAVNMVVKVALAFTIGGPTFGRRFSLAVVPATAVFVLCAVIAG